MAFFWNILTINLLFQKLNTDNKLLDQYNIEFCYAVLEKWILENFRGPFYGNVISRDDSYQWSHEELKFKTKGLGEILDLFDWKIFSRNPIKLRVIRESFPTA